MPTVMPPTFANSGKSTMRGRHLRNTEYILINCRKTIAAYLCAIESRNETAPEFLGGGLHAILSVEPRWRMGGNYGRDRAEF